MRLEKKSVLITGATKGLGRALAFNFAREGARVVLVARDEANLEKTVHEIRSQGGVAFGIAGDISDKHAIYPIAAQAAELGGPVDILVNNASSLGPTPLRWLLDTNCEDLERVIQTNLVGPFRLSKVVIGSMLLRESGIVINISSDAAVEPYPRWGAYAISKAAIDHLTRIWSEELKGTGVQLLSVDPGEMDTEMHAAALPESDVRSLLRPEQVASQIVTFIEHNKWESGVRKLASGMGGV
jgi:NAD(P)-dependent dehydrogenase (short-subunit alcohol dehydrogenase family)